MKIAIVHDWFNTKIGGAERVAFELAAMYPKAPIYTLIYNRAKFSQLLDPARIHTSSLQKLPRFILDRPKALLPLMPRAVRSLELSDYDVIISSSFGFVKNLTPGKSSTHICYCHSPMRFAWDYRDKYLSEIGFGRLRKAAALAALKKIRRWDLKGNGGVDIWIANSQTVAKRIRKYYHRDAQIIYPPADVSSFKPISPRDKKDYYLTMGMLTPYKKIDLAIAAANQGGWQLKVLGDGPERARLNQLAGPTVQVLGYVSESQKRKLLAEACGLIFPSVEDFGIAPIEAMAAGTPIIAYGQGGLTETIVNGKTGIFFQTQSPEAIDQAVKQARGTDFKQTDLLAQARKFDSRFFRRAIKELVEQAGKGYV